MCIRGTGRSCRQCLSGTCRGPVESCRGPRFRKGDFPEGQFPDRHDIYEDGFQKIPCFFERCLFPYFWKKGTFLHVVEFHVSGSFFRLSEKTVFFENGVFRHGGKKAPFPISGKCLFYIYGGNGELWKTGNCGKGDFFESGYFRGSKIGVKKGCFWGVKKGPFLGGQKRGQKRPFFKGGKNGGFWGILGFLHRRFSSAPQSSANHIIIPYINH